MKAVFTYPRRLSKISYFTIQCLSFFAKITSWRIFYFRPYYSMSAIFHLCSFPRRRAAWHDPRKSIPLETGCTWWLIQLITKFGLIALCPWHKFQNVIPILCRILHCYDRCLYNLVSEKNRCQIAWRTLQQIGAPFLIPYYDTLMPHFGASVTGIRLGLTLAYICTTDLCWFPHQLFTHCSPYSVRSCFVTFLRSLITIQRSCKRLSEQHTSINCCIGFLLVRTVCSRPPTEKDCVRCIRTAALSISPLRSPW